MIAAFPGRRRGDEHWHGRNCLKFPREGAAELAAAEPSRARAQDDQVGAFLGRYLRERLGAVAEHEPLVRPVANLASDRAEEVLGARLPLPGRQALVGARRYSVDDVNEHEP